MASEAIQLLHCEKNQPVPAELIDEVAIEEMFVAEELWGPERARISRDILKVNLPSEFRPQSMRWSWSTKALKIPGLAEGPFSPYRLFGLKADAAWQALMLCSCVGHTSRITPPRDVVYVDFVEVAPWNWDLPQLGRPRRFKGVGTQLLELAIRWSKELAFKGRVGLHALPQANQFYTRCGMTDLGPDSSYQQLHYFEFTEATANAYLKGERS